VIGIGINVNQCDFPEGVGEKATSLKLLGYEATPAEVINRLTDIIGRHIYRPTEEIFEIWEKRLSIVGKELRLIGRDGRWAATYLYNDGRLKVENVDTNESMVIGDGESFRYDYE
jgi:biotin-(acetyl-CoA carboxylase) ligase